MKISAVPPLRTPVEHQSIIKSDAWPEQGSTEVQAASADDVCLGLALGESQ